MNPLILKSEIPKIISGNLFSRNTIKNCLHDKGWEMLHNEAVYSGIYGDLSIYKGLSYFFDGKNVIFNGFRLSKSNLTISNILMQFSKEFIDTKGCEFETLNYWGIEEPEDWIHPTLTRIEKEKPNENNRDVILNLKKLSLNDIHNFRFVRRAIKFGLSCKINKNKKLTASHLELVNIFNKNHKDIDDDGKKYIDNWQNVLNKPDSVLFEIHCDKKLTGMLILNLFLKSMPTYAYGFFDNDIKGTSDLAYAGMIEYCKLLDFSQLDLGYSVKKSLLKYKMKWGDVTLRKAPWYITWTKSPSRKLNE